VKKEGSRGFTEFMESAEKLGVTLTIPFAYYAIVER
jgi:hypothetical protein